MTPYLITGDALAMVLGALSDNPHTLRIAIDDGGVKFKLDNGSWSPALGSVDA